MKNMLDYFNCISHKSMKILYFLFDSNLFGLTIKLLLLTFTFLSRKYNCIEP